MGVDAIGTPGGQWAAWSCICLLLAVGLAGCDDAEEGCLDYRALEVDLYAETACDDCCVYPRLILQQLPGRMVGTAVQSITPDSLLLRDDGSSTRLTGLVYYLHDLELEFDDGRLYPLADTFSFRASLADPLVLQSRSLIKAAPLRESRRVTGQLLTEGRVVALRAKFGLPGEYVAGLPLAQTSTSPLALEQDSLLFDFRPGRLGGYRSAFFKTRDADGRRDSTWVDGPAEIDLRYTFPVDTALERSRNLILTLLLPVTPLVDLPSGPVEAETFVATFLRRARIVLVSTSR